MRRTSIRRLSIWVSALFAIAAHAGAAPKLRAQVDQRGDFALIGNTLGHDCRPDVPAPIVGSVGSCGAHSDDSSPDVFWQDGVADGDTPLADARSTAVLRLPEGATVSHAWLYWAARRAGTSADSAVSFERPGEFSQSVSATESFTVPAGYADVHYQSVADVSSLVQAAGSGAYRVSGVDSLSLPDLDQQVAFSGWYLVVFYELASEPPRNLALFDGLELVNDQTREAAELSGFLVPESDFDAKLGVVTFEGDSGISGDSLRFGSEHLSDAANPADNFFNGSRAWLGSPVSVDGDLPRLSGTSGSLSGLDLDVVEISARVEPGQTSAEIEAASSVDVFLLGAFVTSVSTLSPDFASHSDSGGREPDGTLQGGGCACAAPGSATAGDYRLGLALFLVALALRRLSRFLSLLSVDDVGEA